MSYTYQTNPVNGDITIIYKNVSATISFKTIMSIKECMPHFDVVEYINNS